MKCKLDHTLQHQQDAIDRSGTVVDGQSHLQAGAMAFLSLQIGGLSQTELGTGNRPIPPDEETLKIFGTLRKRTILKGSRRGCLTGRGHRLKCRGSRGGRAPNLRVHATLDQLLTGSRITNGY